MKKEEPKIEYLDYMSSVGEYVKWKDISGNIHEGKLINWVQGDIAIIELPDGVVAEVKC